MTLLWSAIALAQVAFLPGYLVTRWLRLDDGFARTWAASFGISLVVNYHVTLLLTLANLYGRTALCGLIALEGLALFRLLQAPRVRAPRAAAGSPLTRFLCPEPGRAADVSVGRLLLLLAGIAPLLYFVAFLPGAFTTIFSGWDALVSWNRWAIDWAQGYLPAWTMHYPQLIPATWSMLYVIAGAELQFLPKGLSLFFPATTVLMLVDLGLRRSRGEFMLAAALTGVSMSSSGGRYLASGYADLPVGFFGLAAVYLLACCEKTSDRSRIRAHIAAATLCAAGCGLTKQAGFYLVAVFPVILLLFLRDRSRSTAGLRPPRMLALVICALLVLVVPWHLYKEYQVYHGFEDREVAYTTGVHLGRTASERAIWAWTIWKEYLSAPLACFVVAAVGLALVFRRALPITLLVTLPFTAIWTFLFSYDQRNLALAHPFIGISAGAGAAAAWSRLCEAWKLRGPTLRLPAGLAPGRAPKLATKRTAALVTLAAAAVAIPWIAREDIPAAHDRQLRALGNEELNEVLYAYHEQHGFEGKILTNYRLLSLHPELSQYVYFDRDARATEFWPFRDPEAFKSVLQRNRRDIRYIVVLKPMDLRLFRLLHEGMRKRQLQVIYRTHKGLIVRLSEIP
jgi:hypothetical protein